MQAFFANFPNKLTLNFPQNIVHQIFHKMSNILYIFRFSRFSADFPIFPQIFQIFRRFSSQWIFPQIFRSCTGSADFPDFPDCGNFPQIFRVKFSRFSARFSALQDPPDFPQIFPLARFSASPPASQVFRTKKRTGNFPALPDHFGYTLKAIYPFVVLSAMFTAI